MSISSEDVLKVAKLAKLQVSASEVGKLAGQLSSIVELVQQLDNVETAGVEPLAHAMDIHTVVRADAIAPSLSRPSRLGQFTSARRRVLSSPTCNVSTGGAWT